MYMPCIISYDICNFLYSNETHIWRYGWTLQVLRSAPLMMMMMDVEDQFKTKWKRRWRKAISGDPDKRIRDHMDDKEVQKRIRLVDTASFTLGIDALIVWLLLLSCWQSVSSYFCIFHSLVFVGVFMAMWVEYLILAAPSAFPWFYLVRLNPLSSYDQLETII